MASDHTFLLSNSLHLRLESSAGFHAGKHCFFDKTASSHGEARSKKERLLFGITLFYMKARDVAGVQWTPFCHDRGGSRDLELRATAGLEVKKSDSFLESLFFNMKARDGTRTRGPNLGKVVLYQLSHSRICSCSVLNTNTTLSCLQIVVKGFFHFFYPM